MSKKIKFMMLVLSAAGLLGTAQAQTVTHAKSPDTDRFTPRPEASVLFTFQRSNTPVGGSDTFNLFGGGAGFALPIKKSNFDLVLDIDATHANSIANNQFDLTLSTYTTGLRYRPSVGKQPLRPFGKVTIGAAHASGSLVDGSATASNASLSLAASVGGGADWALSRHLWLRLVEANYLVTTVDNGKNDHQNILQLNTGVVWRF